MFFCSILYSDKRIYIPTISPPERLVFGFCAAITLSRSGNGGGGEWRATVAAGRGSEWYSKTSEYCRETMYERAGGGCAPVPSCWRHMKKARTALPQRTHRTCKIDATYQGVMYHAASIQQAAANRRNKLDVA